MLPSVIDLSSFLPDSRVSFDSYTSPSLSSLHLLVDLDYALAVRQPRFSPWTSTDLPFCIFLDFCLTIHHILADQS